MSSDREQANRAARPLRELPDRRRGPADRARSRDHVDVRVLAGGHAVARGSLHRACTRPAGSRRVRQAARRLFPGCLRERYPRSGRGAGLRERNVPGAFARRGRGDAARVPVPRALRAVGARFERRSGPGGALSSQSRGAAGRGVGTALDRAPRHARCRPRRRPAPWPPRDSPDTGSDRVCPRLRLACRCRGTPCLPPHPACGDRPGGPASQRARSPLPGGRGSLAGDLGRARPHHPDPSRPRGP